jgi:hypothetical protein
VYPSGSEAVRTLKPGATTSGLRRFDPSTVTGPRLEKLAMTSVFVVAPIENDAS